MKAIRTLQDRDCHWYLVPNELAPRFNELNSKIEEHGEDFKPQDV